MKTSKKILIIGTSLLLTALISAALAGGLTAFFGIYFWGSFWFFNALQILGNMAWQKYGETDRIVKQLEEYNQKPYKKYVLGLNCSHCGSKNEIEVDLNDTEFRCANCKKYNGIHVNFMTAAIAEPAA